MSRTTESPEPMVTRHLRIDMYDSRGALCDGHDYKLIVPAGGSLDEDTDDKAAGEAAAQLVSRFVASMTGGGLEWSVRARFIPADEYQA